MQKEFILAPSTFLCHPLDGFVHSKPDSRARGARRLGSEGHISGGCLIQGTAVDSEHFLM